MSSASRDSQPAGSPPSGPGYPGYHGDHGGPGDPSSVGDPLAPVEITDPRALRALAHPARIAILQHLVLDGPATATECAEVAGLSPSACSYHLRALARYGYAEEDRSQAADGRHRPWRAAVTALSIGRDPAEPVATRAAGRLLMESLRVHLGQQRADYLDREAEYSQQWQQAAGYTQDVMHLTAAELVELRARLDALVREYRRLKPEDRPPGARRVGAYLEFTPWFDPEASQ